MQGTLMKDVAQYMNQTW